MSLSLVLKDLDTRRKTPAVAQWQARECLEPLEVRRGSFAAPLKGGQHCPTPWLQTREGDVFHCFKPVSLWQHVTTILENESCKMSAPLPSIVSGSLLPLLTLPSVRKVKGLRKPEQPKVVGIILATLALWYYTCDYVMSHVEELFGDVIKVTYQLI